MGLNSPSIRRFNNTIITKQVPRHVDIATHNQCVAQYLASGGPVEVIPGFTEIAPLPPHKVFTPEPKPKKVTVPRPKKDVAFLPDTEEWRTVPGYPQYQVTRTGEVRGRKSGHVMKGRYWGAIAANNAAGDRVNIQRSAMVKLAWGDL